MHDEADQDRQTLIRSIEAEPLSWDQAAFATLANGPTAPELEQMGANWRN